MAWIDLVTLFALAEFFGFAWAVGKARQRYGIKAPATTGNDVFERTFRVQQNTVELLIIFIPALWIAARYWNPVWVAATGAVFIVGRAMYFYGYVNEPTKRSMGFLISFAPIVVLWAASLWGAVRSLF
jgi:glutathione S-transferase